MSGLIEKGKEVAAGIVIKNRVKEAVNHINIADNLSSGLIALMMSGINQIMIITAIIREFENAFKKNPEIISQVVTEVYQIFDKADTDKLIGIFTKNKDLFKDIGDNLSLVAKVSLNEMKKSKPDVDGFKAIMRSMEAVADTMKGEKPGDIQSHNPGNELQDQINKNPELKDKLRMFKQKLSAQKTKVA